MGSDKIRDEIAKAIKKNDIKLFHKLWAQDFKWKEDIIFNAASAGNMEIFKFLVEKEKISINYLIDEVFVRPLDIAMEIGHLEMVKYIVDHPDFVLDHCNIHLIEAVSNGHRKVVKFILKKFFNKIPKEIVKQCFTEACRGNDPRMIEMFISMDPDLINVYNGIASSAKLMEYHKYNRVSRVYKIHKQLSAEERILSLFGNDFKSEVEKYIFFSI